MSVWIFLKVGQSQGKNKSNGRCQAIVIVLNIGNGRHWVASEGGGGCHVLMYLCNFA
ncbi:sensor histidine kinase [Sesbania bispinosa]|nr:sensor histidine kinase [Sesbania bispinosa]